MMRMRILPLALLAIAIALPAATAAAERIRVVGEGTIGDEWTLAPGEQLAAPLYPAEYAADPEQVCVAIGYLLGPDGHPSDFALLKSWTSGSNTSSRTDYWRAFADAASQALAQWRFVPKPGVASPRPTYTVATFMFGPPAASGVREHCAIASLQTRLLELQRDSRANRLMSRGVFSRLEIDPDLKERFRLSRRDRIESTTMPWVPPPQPLPPSTQEH
jgi:hypothetical protein